LDFELSDEDMKKISELDRGERYYHRTDEQLVQFAGWQPTYE
jgi:diketogulonate reductase-like aldo/keto reductase